MNNSIKRCHKGCNLATVQVLPDWVLVCALVVTISETRYQIGVSLDPSQTMNIWGAGRGTPFSSGKPKSFIVINHCAKTLSCSLLRQAWNIMIPYTVYWKWLLLSTLLYVLCCLIIRTEHALDRAVKKYST